MVVVDDAAEEGGATCGGILATLVVPAIGFPAAAQGVSASLACVTEAVATFFLCLVVLQTATVARMANKVSAATINDTSLSFLSFTG